MFIINDLYSKYGIEYDVKDKILFIREKIPVAEFVMLKRLVSRIKEEVRDIRVGRMVRKSICTQSHIGM